MRDIYASDRQGGVGHGRLMIRMSPVAWAASDISGAQPKVSEH